MPLDPNILKRVRALLIKSDPARNSEPHEREVAKRLAQKIMDRYNLTLADIPQEQFSARNSYYRPPRNYSRPRPRYDAPPRKRRHKATVMYDFTTHETYVETSAKVQHVGKLFFALAHGLGYETRRTKTNETTIKWTAYTQDQQLKSLADRTLFLLKHAYNRSVILYNPSNANAFQRAFYEEAGFVLKEKLLQQTKPNVRPFRPPRKAKNEQGIEAGKAAAEKIDVLSFT